VRLRCQSDARFLNSTVVQRPLAEKGVGDRRKTGKKRSGREVEQMIHALSKDSKGVVVSVFWLGLLQDIVLRGCWAPVGFLLGC